MFLLAIHFYRKLSPKLVFRTRNAPDIRDIDTGKVCTSLGAKHTEAILGLHFYSKSKNDFYKTFKSASPEALES